LVDCRQGVADGEGSELLNPTSEESIGADHQAGRSQSGSSREHRIKLRFTARRQNMELDAKLTSRLVARAQQDRRVRRIGVLMSGDENDPEEKARLSGFMQGLAELGWTDGRNMRMDVRWAAANAGFVASLPRSGGNITGFIGVEAAMGGKWLQLPMEMAPGVKRVAAMFNPDTAPGGGAYYLPTFEAAAQSFKVEPIVSRVHSEAEIETVMTSLGREPRGGLVVMPDGFMSVHRAPIILLAAQNNVPAVYYNNFFCKDGGLLSYGSDVVDINRRAASYVDRILRGAKPAELPVQVPVKFEMVLNAKTAKALGLTIPERLLATRSDL
jgi:putative ABC transport system substrate-binding protein